MRVLVSRAGLISALMIAQAVAAAGEQGFKSIFDGKSLKGWDGNSKFWRVEDGAITGEATPENATRANTFLIWRGGEPADFELKLEFKLIRGNSGVQYRSYERPAQWGRWVVGGYQADIAYDNTWCAVLHEERAQVRSRDIIARPGERVVVGRDHRPRIVERFGDTAELRKRQRRGQWNEYHIIAQGNRLRQYINGQLMIDVTDNDPGYRRLKGLIALQLHGGFPMKVQFRNIRLRILHGQDATAVRPHPETTGGWREYERNPVLGGGRVGTCFDPTLPREGGRYWMHFSWRPKRSIALARSKDGIRWQKHLTRPAAATKVADRSAVRASETRDRASYRRNESVWTAERSTTICPGPASLKRSARGAESLQPKTLTAPVDGGGPPEGEFAVGKDGHGLIVRVNVQRIKDWSKVPGVKRFLPAGPAPGQSVLCHAVISNMKDVDGDGRLDFFRQLIEKPYSQVTRFDENGKQVWVSQRLSPAAGDESGMPIVDLDGDGNYELVLSQWAMLHCLDAATGKVKWKRPLEKGGHPGPGTWDYPMVVGHFDHKERFAVVVRAGLKIHCFGPDGAELWSYGLSGHTYGHELECCDVDGDGLDEIFSSRNGTMNAIRHDGKPLWSDETVRNHSDAFAFGDLDGDGRTEVVYDHDGCGGAGPLYVVDGVTGKLKFTIDYRREGMNHCQGFTCAEFNRDAPGLEIAVVDKSRLLLLYGSQGKLLWKRKTPSSLVTKADWDGDGRQDVLLFAVGVDLDPAWSVWNGRGERLFAMSFLPCPRRSHATMCGPHEGFGGYADLDGNGRADVLVAYGPWKTGRPQYWFVAEAPAQRRP